jgi:periplasmic protein TonB
MPDEMFGVSVRERERTRQSSLIFASAIVHAGLVFALIVVSMLLPGVLPAPRASMIWDGPRIVRIADIPLPPRAPRKTDAAPPVDHSIAPIDAPDGFAPEPEVDRAEREIDLPGMVPGGIDLPGIPGNAVAPPPPPVVAQAPAGPVRLHAGIEPPRKIHDVMPAYPVLARTVGASGVVIIEATIDARGDVVAAKVLRSVPTLDQAAVDAVRQWKYTPARLNGEPVAVLITVTVNFMLGGR